MDGTLNEYDGLDTEGFPSVLLFKGGDNTPEEKFKNRKLYEGERSVAALIEFMKNNTHHGVSDVITLENEAHIEEQEKADEEKGQAEEGEDGHHDGHDHDDQESPEDDENDNEKDEGDDEQANFHKKEDI